MVTCGEGWLSTPELSRERVGIIATEASLAKVKDQMQLLSAFVQSSSEVVALLTPGICSSRELTTSGRAERAMRCEEKLRPAPVSAARHTCLRSGCVSLTPSCTVTSDRCFRPPTAPPAVARSPPVGVVTLLFMVVVVDFCAAAPAPAAPPQLNQQERQLRQTALQRGARSRDIVMHHELQQGQVASIGVADLGPLPLQSKVNVSLLPNAAKATCTST